MRAASSHSPLRLALTLAAFSASAALQAQPLTDPTRPPASWLAAQARPAGAAAEVTTPEMTAAPDVQIVVSGATRQFAMVDGVAVRPGETYQGAKLLSIQQSGAVWQKDGSILKTNNNAMIEKKTYGDARSASPAKPGKTRINGGS